MGTLVSAFFKQDTLNSGFRWFPVFGFFLLVLPRFPLFVFFPLGFSLTLRTQVPFEDAFAWLKGDEVPPQKALDLDPCGFWFPRARDWSFARR